MAVAFTELVASTVAPFAQSLSVKADGSATIKFQLPVQARQFLAENLNKNNPLAFFTKDITAESSGSGSVELTYSNYADQWVEKAAYGQQGNFNDVDLTSEFFKWNKPLVLQEALKAHDVKRGIPNVLATRLSFNLIKYIQKSIKHGFEVFGNGLGKAQKFETYTPATTGSTQDKGAVLLLALTQAATKLITAAEVAKETVTIVINPLAFDELAFAGLIGNRTEQTFAGGQYSVGIAGGYRIASGEMFLPDQIDTSATATAANKDLVAIIGTSDSFLHSTDVIAANIDRLIPSNDNGSYIEVADIAALPKRTTAKGLAVAVVK